VYKTNVVFGVDVSVIGVLLSQKQVGRTAIQSPKLIKVVASRNGRRSGPSPGIVGMKVRWERQTSR
jgi:hypothetical protein